MMTDNDYLFMSKLEKARKGDADAQRFVGKWYFDPKFGFMDYNKAVYWLRKAAKQNELFADYDLAQLYHRGYGVPQDDGKALLHYRKLMDRNDMALERVEMLTMTDRGKKRVVMSLEEVLAGAERGDAEALCELGWRHFIHWGVEWSSEKATECFEKAAKQGHTEAKYFLYWMYKKGDSRKGYREKAAVLCTEAAEQGHIAAQYHLGRVYGFGIGVGMDFYKALECYRRAEELGHPLAKNKRERTEQVLNRLEQNKSEEVLNAIRKAEDGDAVAQRDLGLRYMDGDGVPADPKQAAYWLEKAAAQGEKWGRLYLGECYEKGYGVARNIARALELYEQAGKQGAGEACYRLGNMYKEGRNVEQSYAKAVEWYELAVERGNERAMCELGHMYADGRGVAKNKTRAYNLYWKAVDEGYEFARVYLDLLE